MSEFLAKEGQLLLPMLDLITQAEMAVDELIDVAGRATVEAILLMSAQQVAGAKHPGKRGGRIHWHGRQRGVVNLAERKLRVQKPRLRRKGEGKGAEVEIPAYEVMQCDSRLGQRMGRHGDVGDGEALPPDHGVPGFVDAEGVLG